MAGFEELPELVRHARLETIIQGNRTIHTRPRGRRGFSHQEIWARYDIIGHGGYGQVWVERMLNSAERSTPVLRAVKCIHMSTQRRDYVRELEALAKFSSNSSKYAEFFVQFYGWYESPGWLYAAMEYCRHGDLKNYLQKHKTLTEKEMQEITLQILGGLSLMHEAGFAHRDVKPAVRHKMNHGTQLPIPTDWMIQNILIKSAPPKDWWVKLCDLGLSKRAETISGSTTVRGTPGFIPPELLGLDGQDPKHANLFSADIWCLGETIFQTLSAHSTFQSFGGLIEYVKGSVGFPQVPLEEAGVSKSGIDFIGSLMSPVPSQRLSAKQALDQGWLIFGEEETIVAARSLYTPARFELEFEGDDGNSEASAAWTEVGLTKAKSGPDRSSDQTPTFREIDGGCEDLSFDGTMKLSVIHQASDFGKGESSTLRTIIPGSPVEDDDYSHTVNGDYKHVAYRDFGRSKEAGDDGNPIDSTRRLINTALPLAGGSKEADIMAEASSWPSTMLLESRPNMQELPGALIHGEPGTFHDQYRRVSISARCSQVADVAGAASRELSKQQEHLSHKYHTNISLSKTEVEGTTSLLNRVADQCIDWDERSRGAVVRLHVLLSLILTHSTDVQQLRSDCGPNCNALWLKWYVKITGSYSDRGPSCCEKRWLRTCHETMEKTGLSLDKTFALYRTFLEAISSEITKDPDLDLAQLRWLQTHVLIVYGRTPDMPLLSSTEYRDIRLQAEVEKYELIGDIPAPRPKRK